MLYAWLPIFQRRVFGLEKLAQSEDAMVVAVVHEQVRQFEVRDHHAGNPQTTSAPGLDLVFLGIWADLPVACYHFACLESCLASPAVA